MFALTFSFFFILIAIICFALWVYCLIDILQNEFEGKNMKIIWLLLVIFMPFVGSILYLIIGRDQRFTLGSDGSDEVV